VKGQFLERTMPVHDWTRVDGGTFHAFHLVWVGQLQTALNGGLLPSGYYALAEQHAGSAIPDMLTLHTSPADVRLPLPSGVATVTKTRPRAQHKLAARASPKGKRRTIAIRHVSGHRIVALVEIVSPANKDRRRSVTELVNKAVAALQLGIHVSVVDLLPPGRHDPSGLHGAVWDRFDPETPYELTAERPLTLAAYAAGKPPRAYVNHLAVGDRMPEMPLFLTADHYVDLPLEETYTAAYAGMPVFWREVIEGKRQRA
jgi:hypothetical protein